MTQLAFRTADPLLLRGIHQPVASSVATAQPARRDAASVRPFPEAWSDLERRFLGQAEGIQRHTAGTLQLYSFYAGPHTREPLQTFD